MIRILITGPIAAVLLMSIFIFFLGFSFAFAEEFRPFYRSPRAQAMGNAFTAIAEDDDAIFYNPAGLAGVKGFSLKVASVNLDAANDLWWGIGTLKSALANPGISSVNALIGKAFYARANTNFSLVAPGFGLVALVDYQVALRLKNVALPQGILGYQGTYGGQMGFAKGFGKLNKKWGQVRAGLAFKVLNRTGGYQKPSLTQLLAFDSSSFTNNIAPYGLGIGADIGVQYLRQFGKKFTLLAGAAMSDLGDTSFAGGADPQKSSLSFGVAGRVKTGDMQATLAYDYRHILDYADWRKKTHLGLELKFPILALYAGLSQFNVTYGLGLDVGIVKLMYLSYAEEQGTLAGQDPERRTMIHAAVKFEL